MMLKRWSCWLELEGMVSMGGKEDTGRVLGSIQGVIGVEVLSSTQNNSMPMFPSCLTVRYLLGLPKSSIREVH